MELGLSQLTLYSLFNMHKPYLVSSDFAAVAGVLAEDGVVLERRSPHLPIAGLGTQDIMTAYAEQIDTVKHECGCLHADCVSMKPEDSAEISIRDQFLSEHTHTDDEVRWFLHGGALFYIHVDARIHILHCEQGDFIVIPKGTRHWLDMGPQPEYCCLRWFNSEEGLATHFTGNYVAESTPRWESIMARHARSPRCEKDLG